MAQDRFDIDTLYTTSDQTIQALVDSWPYGWDALILYFLYIKNCRIQKTNAPWCNDSFMMQATWWGSTKLRNAKNVLKELWLVEIKNQSQTWQKGFWKAYMQINFIMKATENIEQEKPQQGAKSNGNGFNDNTANGHTVNEYIANGHIGTGYEMLEYNKTKCLNSKKQEEVEEGEPEDFSELKGTIELKSREYKAVAVLDFFEKVSKRKVRDKKANIDRYIEPYFKRGWTIQGALEAIWLCQHSTFYVGINDRWWRYSLEYIFRKWKIDELLWRTIDRTPRDYALKVREFYMAQIPDLNLPEKIEQKKPVWLRNWLNESLEGFQKQVEEGVIPSIEEQTRNLIAK